MSQQADKLLNRILEEEGELAWDEAVEQVKEACDVKTNTAETYIRRSDQATQEMTMEGDKVVVDPAQSGDTVVNDEDDALEVEAGERTSSTFGELTKLQDIDHPLVPDHETGYFRRKVIGRKTDVKVGSSAMEDDDFASLFIGEAGVGKDRLVLHMCAKTNRPVIRITMNDDPDLVDLLIGHYSPNGDGGFEFKYGLLPIAMQNGFTFVADEINMASGKVQSQMNDILEDADQAQLTIPETNEVITPDPRFKFVGTMNPPKVGYGGTEELNQAFQSRFIPIEIPPLDEDAEKKVVAEKTEWDEDNRELDTLLRGDGGVIPGIRSLYETGKISTWVSTRDVIKIGRMAHRLGDARSAAEMILTGIASPEDKDPIRSAVTDQNWPGQTSKAQANDADPEDLGDLFG